LDTAIVAALGGEPTLRGHPSCQTIPECGELIFIFVVSSLYKLYREAGGDDLKFLNSKIAATGSGVTEHYALVCDLRTFDQHDLRTGSPETMRRRNRCRLWFEQTVELKENDRPVGAPAWNKCVESLISQAINYISTLREFVKSLNGGMGEYVKKEWALIRTRSIPHGDFDKLVYETAGDLGMSRDVVSFRKQHYERIVVELRAQRFDVEVVNFIRKAITSRLVEEFPGVILVPDDLKALGVKPGRELGAALKEAQRIWVDGGCLLTKQAVIDALRQSGKLP
jgi:hypothetical protein